MAKEDLETKFKTADDPFRIVFVCAMWITGFDAPCVSTIYLDKPMRNHTLMQTIARANRVFGKKNNGLIVDYVGVFRDLQKALAIYGSAAGGGVKPGETPVEAKDALITALQHAIDETTQFCTERGVTLEPIIRAPGFQKVAFLDDAATHLVDKKVIAAVDDAVEKVIVNDDLKKKYMLTAACGSFMYPVQQEFLPALSCLANFLAKRPLRPQVQDRPSRRSRRLGAVTSKAVEQAADQASSRVSAMAITVWPQLAAQTHQRPSFPRPSWKVFQPRQVRKCRILVIGMSSRPNCRPEEVEIGQRAGNFDVSVDGRRRLVVPTSNAAGEFASHAQQKHVVD